MDNKEIIKSIHKILFIREDYDNGIVPFSFLDTYLSNLIILLNGINFNNKEKVISTINGIRILGDNLSHKELRSSILGLMNDIERCV